MKITGSTVVITGGVSGLGRATAEKLVGSGARVVLLDLATSPGAQAAQAMGPNALFAAGDVTSAEDVTAALDAGLKRFGAIHGLEYFGDGNEPALILELVPGDTLAERMARGIELDENTWNQIVTCARSLGVRTDLIAQAQGAGR